MAKKSAKGGSGASPKYPKKVVPLKQAAEKAANAPELPGNFGRNGQSPADRKM